MIKTAGTWDPGDRQIIFAAANGETLRRASHNRFKLIAVNELTSELTSNLLRGWLAAGDHVLLDSGVFNLANNHANSHGCSMDVALSLSPNEIDGFSQLNDQYLALARELGNQCWGYIEIDQGGRKNKIKTRQRLHSSGLNPIPVYHPLNDGWDYFDYLAERYDRICVGNIVHADQATRVRLVATILQRRKRYPRLWIHGLGMGPCPLAMSCALDSVDASSWLSPVRWSTWPVGAAMTKISEMPERFYYQYETDPSAPDGHRAERRLLGFDLVAHQTNWRRHVASQGLAS